MDFQPKDNRSGNIKLALMCAGIAVACLLFAFVFGFYGYQPISRDEAVSFSGAFERYETSENYCGICFADGSEYEVYPHTETEEFRERMMSLPKGTALHLLINPDEEYVVEIRTDDEEILNFDASQEDIDSYDDGYMIVSVIFCVAGAVLILVLIGYSKNQRVEEAKVTERARQTLGGTVDSKILRRADGTVKCRILLETRVGDYQICYRRVKSVNELVINGMVYDEKKGIVEYAHTLSAVVDGHWIEVGYDGEAYSYIRFDEQEVARKLRLL